MPLILRFLIDIVLKSAMKIETALIVIIVLLIAIGMISPIHVIGEFVSIFRTGQGMVVKVNQIAGYPPYSSAPSNSASSPGSSKDMDSYVYT